MGLTKHKLKKEMMQRTMKKADRNSGREDNPKILPYYQLDFGQKMEVMFVPYEDGDLFKHFKKHGPNMKAAAVGSIDCIYHSRGESCPACAQGFSYTKDGKGTDMSKKWMAKDYYVAQVVVISAPFDIVPLTDGNEVRIFFMPFAVMEKIKESYEEGIVDDPTDHVFVIKKSKSAGGDASYANSYFNQAPAEQEIFDEFADSKIELHDLFEEKVAPEEITLEEAEEWCVKAEKAINDSSSTKRTARSSSKDDEEEEEEDEKPKRGSRLQRRKAADPDPDEGEGEEEEEDEDDAPPTRSRLNRRKAAEPSDDEEDGEQEEDNTSSKASSIRDKLRRNRK